MRERETPLFELREIYEAQNTANLLGMKAVHLARVSDHEIHVNLINDVLNGYGAYDADDGTLGSPEHPEDNRWIGRGLE